MSDDPSKQNASRRDDPDLRNAEKALRRAAAKAKARAIQAGYKPVVYRDGRIIEGPLDDLDAA